MVQSSSSLHSYGAEASDSWNGIAALDDYAHACLNLLGVFGERLNRKLELLELPTIEAKCEYYLDLWYSINLKLASYYHQREQFNLNRVIEHLAQCQLTRPDEPEPVLALLKITYQHGNLSKFNRVYRHYKKCCQEIELQPDEAIQAFYNQVATARTQSIQTTITNNNNGGYFASTAFLAAS